jgi:hypothetical protein
VDRCAHFEHTSVRGEDTAHRMQRIKASLATDGGVSVQRRDIRFITAVVGTGNAISAAEFAKVLSEIDRRRDDSLHRGVFGVLLAGYRNEQLRSLARAYVVRHVECLRPNVKLFCNESNILENDNHLEPLARELVRSRDIRSFCLSKNISSNILLSSYGTELKLAAIREALISHDVELIRKNFDWSFLGIGGTPTAEYYEAMLTPFEDLPPTAEIQRVIISKTVEKYGDPRIYSWPIPSGQDGQSRRDRCVATVKRWLSIEYLDLFMRIIERTAVDKQFRPRKSFWLQYFEADKISDVTLILASDADRVARRTRTQTTNAEYMQWAKLTSALPNQSVLLMRLGDLIIAEWSHSGAIRFWKATNESAPQFHSPEYLGHQLRQSSLKVKVGSEFKDAITHHENGHWMRWASRAIEHHTGVSV